MTRSKLCVLKLGSSVLPGEAALRPCCSEIARWRRRGYRVVAVVSAFAGVTDELFATAARAARAAPSARADLVAALQETGEARAAALLALSCHGYGLEAVTLDAASLGIVGEGGPLDSRPIRLAGSALRRAIDEFPVVVVPGFIARSTRGRARLLGRGGSDMTAIYLASELEAHRCVLLKDVPGWYVEDPRTAGLDSPRFVTLTWNDALAAPAPLVQDRAVALARDLGQSFEIGTFGSRHPTVVGSCPTRLDTRSLVARGARRVPPQGLRP